jgi:hypothetical protein
VDYVYNHKSTGDKSYSCPVICILLTQPWPELVSLVFKSPRPLFWKYDIFIYK